MATGSSAGVATRHLTTDTGSVGTVVGDDRLLTINNLSQKSSDMEASVSDLVAIASLPNEDEALEVSATLTQAGIVAVLETVGHVSGASASEESRTVFFVRVPPEQVQQARQILEEQGVLHAHGKGWHCTTCGTSIEAAYPVCWSCGTEREGVEFVDAPQPEAPAAPASSCSSGGCGPSGCGSTSGVQAGGLFAIEVPAEWDMQVQANDQKAGAAFVLSIASVIVPPVSIVAAIMVGWSSMLILTDAGTKKFYWSFGLTLAALIEFYWLCRFMQWVG